MSKSIPTVQRYMTTSPLSVAPSDTLEHAMSVMKHNDIRHLPVILDSHLVGIITERDLALAENWIGVNPKQELVQSAMTSKVLTVAPDSPLDQVASEMAAGKYGSAVVTQNHKVVGVLTTVDVCRALAELLHSRLG
jgi:acetoin utilization protein AcuB